MLFEKKEKDLRPGDKGYKGGIFYGSTRINGKSYNTRVVKDKNGNILYSSISEKFLGIF